MIRSASVTGAWHGSPRGRCRGCSSFRRVKTQEGFDAKTLRSPPAGEIEACHSRPAVWRWHINGLARISARRVGRTEVACGDELQRQLFGRPVRKTCSFRRPSALRKRRRPANRESLRNIRSEVFYGIDMQERSSLPLAAEPSSARDRYGICVRCLPFISVFGNYIPFYTAVPPKPDCRSGPCPKPPPRRGLGVTPICKRGSAANAPTASRVQRLGKPTECKARYGCLVFLRPESRLQVPVCSRRLCASLCRSTGSGKLRRINPFSAT